MRRSLSASLFLFSLWLTCCSDSKQQEVATITLSKDKSQFSGTLIRQDQNSVTLVGQDGDTHTFLFRELSDIRYGALSGKTDFSAVRGAVTATPPATGGGETSVTLRVPAGETIPVRAGQFIDSCCSPIGTLELGATDADVKDAEGHILIPQGASVTFVVRDEKTVAGRVVMQFELASADFNNRHYLVSSAAASDDPGAVVTFTGSKDSGLPGKSLHIEDNSAMVFRAATPLAMKSSQ